MIAVDMNTRWWGGLGKRVGRTNAGTVWDAVRDVHTLTRPTEVERWVQRGPTGLHALVGEVEISRERRPPTLYEAMAVVAALRPLYRLVVLDLPAADTRGAWLALAEATVPMLAARATTDSLQHTMRLLAQLRAAGLHTVADQAVIVVMTATPAMPRDVRAVARQAGTVAGALLTVPYDPALAAASPIDVRRLRRATRRAVLDLAAEVLRHCPTSSEPIPAVQVAASTAAGTAASLALQSVPSGKERR
ncbi:MinD/ParA family ATP-binding protein [Couchioplanes azureus]|uniref:MinD/ParA family ATP-binding protein n=1 Tax=Couchioplanes caeruleus TaxID=56438 RepID=UPI0016703484|nr:hypothetical protein [Couchioplanes caeruleus]